MLQIIREYNNLIFKILVRTVRGELVILNKNQEYLINNFYIWYNCEFGNSISSKEKETARGALFSVKWHW